MNFFKITAFVTVLFFSLSGCKKDPEKLWKVEIKTPVKPVEITDISAELYNPKVTLENFKQKYPWFQDAVTDEELALRRTDSAEINVYREAISKIDQKKLAADLASLFSHIQYYFPKFKIPKVYLYSSALQGIKDPIFLQTEKNMLFIDITGFMGEKNPYYKGLELYLQRSMNPVNIVPKTSQIFAENFVPFSRNNQKFLDQVVYQGKLMTLQDAFLPDYPDHLKINYSSEQYEWAKANEVNIWDYFVEKNLIYSDDPKLVDRFIMPAPFSKFYAEIDNESSPQIGIFTGWQICRKFFEKNPDTKLQQFLQMSATEIFNKSEYKPKN